MRSQEIHWAGEYDEFPEELLQEFNEVFPEEETDAPERRSEHERKEG